MQYRLRKTLAWVALGLYWPVLFTLAHIPIPKTVMEAGVSDKSLHFAAYLLLVFLWWAVIGQDAKVRWTRPLVWWVLLAVLGYGVLDEWLQGFVRSRTMDPWDLAANMAGALTCLALLSVLSFWPSLLLVSATLIVIATVCAQKDLARIMPVAHTAIPFCMYAVFTGLWLRYLAVTGTARASHGFAWRAHRALAMPMALLVIAKVTAVALGRPFSGRAMLAAGAGIGAAYVMGAWVQRVYTADRRSRPVARN